MKLIIYTKSFGGSGTILQLELWLSFSRNNLNRENNYIQRII